MMPFTYYTYTTTYVHETDPETGEDVLKERLVPVEIDPDDVYDERFIKEEEKNK